jgi:hypothetical protein
MELQKRAWPLARRLIGATALIGFAFPRAPYSCKIPAAQKPKPQWGATSVPAHASRRYVPALKD